MDRLTFDVNFFATLLSAGSCRARITTLVRYDRCGNA